MRHDKSLERDGASTKRHHALGTETLTWILTDGKAGDEGQCLAVAQAIGVSPTIKRVSPKPPWVWAMPWGPVDPREASHRAGSPIAPPFPSLLIASGRRAVPSVKAVKRASKEQTFTVILKDPRTGARAADLIWVQEHDALRGPNVLVTLTPPHRLTPQRLQEARDSPDSRLAHLPHPRVAVLVGGDSRHHRFGAEDIERFTGDLTRLARSGAGLMMTPSRRTPASLQTALARLAEEFGGFFWEGEGSNPYVSLLALADAVVVTGDSTNMAGEAAATGVPLLVFEPSGGHPKLTRFLDALRARGIAHLFQGRLEGEAYPPLDATPEIAASIAESYTRWR